MRGVLDGLYRFSGALAALGLIAIAVIILASIVTRWMGVFVPGLSEYAGYAMAASSFLALAYTFGHGGHIRVNLLLYVMKGAARRVLELWCLCVAAGLSAYLSWYAIKMVRVSYKLGDVSEGSDATALWIPQIPMAVGAVILTIALVDRLIAVARGASIDSRGEAAGPAGGLRGE